LRGLGAWVLAKLRYKGKSFRWYKKRGALILRFGHSHLVASVPAHRNIWWRRRGRMKIIFYGSNYYALRAYLVALVAWRPMNIYHGRGLRLSRQRVVRKAGKVSAYR
jgi:ribosomal protein L6P/L9E